MNLDLLRKKFQGDYGSPRHIRRWYRNTYRGLRRMGFKALGRGNFINGKFRAAVRFSSDPSNSVAALIKIMGPDPIRKPPNLYDMPHIKFICLNAAGKICKIPAKNWDRKRKSRSINEL